MIIFGIKLKNFASIWLWNDLFGVMCHTPMFQSPVCPPPPPRCPPIVMSITAFNLLGIFWSSIVSLCVHRIISLSPKLDRWNQSKFPYEQSNPALHETKNLLILVLVSECHVVADSLLHPVCIIKCVNTLSLKRICFHLLYWCSVFSFSFNTNSSQS